MITSIFVQSTEIRPLHFELGYVISSNNLSFSIALVVQIRSIHVMAMIYVSVSLSHSLSTFRSTLFVHCPPW